jgi:hypothetical protein
MLKYSLTIANEGLFTLVIPMEKRADFMKNVFPAPRSPLRTTLSPFLQDDIKSEASIADSSSLFVFMVEG